MTCIFEVGETPAENLRSRFCDKGISHAGWLGSHGKNLKLDRAVKKISKGRVCNSTQKLLVKGENDLSG